jgi:protein TorT
MRCSFALAIVAGMLFVPAQGPGADEAKPFPVDVWEPPFNHQRQHVHKQYVPLAQASKQWQLCALIPHLKDDYWLAVNSALIMEARRLGVRLNLFEAGGYEHLDTQKRQLAECLSKGTDGLIVGAISAEGLDDLIGSSAARGVPIVDLINGGELQGDRGPGGGGFL